MNSEERFKTIEYKCPHCEETVNVEKPEDLRYCKCNRFEWLRTDYFHGKKFVPKKLADELLVDYHIVTPTNVPTPYYYNQEKGYYEEAKNKLTKEINIRLKHDASEHRTRETLIYIQAVTTTENYEEPEPTLINLANGTYDLDDEVLIEHNPSNFFLNGIPVAYDAKAECPRTHAFLREITANECDALALEEFAGYCLYRGMPAHKAFLLHGEGGNGKSVMLSLLQALLGEDNYEGIPLQDITGRGFLRAELYGKLANIFADLPNTALSQGGTGIFKALTGGDKVSAEKKFVQKTIKMRNYAKFIFSCNKIPRPGGEEDSYAFWRRWNVLTFPNTFEGSTRDPHLIEKLRQELPGFLNLALEGLKRLRANHWSFSNDKTVAESRVDYIKNSDSLKYFIETRVEGTNSRDDYLLKDEFYREYSLFVKEKGLGVPAAKNNFGRRLPRLIPEIVDGRKVVDGRQETAWFGVKFRDNDANAVKVESDAVKNESKTDYSNNHTTTNNDDDKIVSQYHNSIEKPLKNSRDSMNSNDISNLSSVLKESKIYNEIGNIPTIPTNPTFDKNQTDLKVFFRRNDGLVKRSELEDFLELAGHEPKQTKALIDSLVSNGSLTTPKAGYLQATEDYLR